MAHTGTGRRKSDKRDMFLLHMLGALVLSFGASVGLAALFVSF